MRRRLVSPAMAPTERTTLPRAAGKSHFRGKHLLGSADRLFGVVALAACRVQYRLCQQLDQDSRQPHLKAGADIRRVRDDLLQGNNNAAAGQFYFQENTTSAPGATAFNGSATGEANDMASILFDVPYKVGQDTNSTFPCYRQTWLFFFVSDKWQVGQKLTLDLGLRYELYPPATPRKAGGFVNYNADQQYTGYRRR